MKISEKINKWMNEEMRIEVDQDNLNKVADILKRNKVKFSKTDSDIRFKDDDLVQEIEDILKKSKIKYKINFS